MAKIKKKGVKLIQIPGKAVLTGQQAHLAKPRTS